MSYRITFEGHKLDINRMDHQHLSNIVHYTQHVLKNEISLVDVTNELKKRFGGIVLPYRPLLRFKYEIDTLRDLNMFVADTNCSRRIIIVHPRTRTEIGEIICEDMNERYRTLFPNSPGPKQEVDWKKEYDPTMSKQYHISFTVIRELYSNVPRLRLLIEELFFEAVFDLKDSVKAGPRERFEITRKQLDELLLSSKDYNFTKKILEDWLVGYKLPDVEFCKLGTLLLRTGHPNNVYTIQHDGAHHVGIFNITHGQWWGNKLKLSDLSCVKKGVTGTARYITKNELKDLCGSHNPENLVIFTEAMKHIKK